MRFLSIPTWMERSRVDVLRDCRYIGLLRGETEPPASISSLHPVMDETSVLVVIDLIGVIFGDTYYYSKGAIMACIKLETFNQLKEKGKERYLVELAGGSARIFTYPDLGRDFLFLSAWKNTEKGYCYTAVAIKTLGADTHPSYLQVAKRAHSNNWKVEFPESTPISYRATCADYVFNWKPLVEPKAPETSVLSETEVLKSGIGYSTGVDLNGGVVQDSNSEFGVDSSIEATGFHASGGRKYLEPVPQSYNEMLEAVKLAEDNVKVVIKKMQELSDIRLESKDFSSDDELSEEEKEELVATLEEQEELENMLTGLASKIRESWQHRNGETGRALFLDALRFVFTDLRKLPKPTINGVTVLEEAIMMLEEKIVTVWEKSSKEGTDGNKFLDQLVEKRTEVFFALLNIILGVRYPLYQVYTSAIDSLINMLRVWMRNPYYLAFIDSNLSLSDMDRLASFAGYNLLDESVVRVRSVAYMHTVMLDANSDLVRESTLLPFEDVVNRITSGVVLTKNEYGNLLSYGMYISQSQFEMIRYYLKPELQKAWYTLPTSGWNNVGKRSAKMVYQIRDVNNLSVVRDYLKTGLGVLFTTNEGRFIGDYILVRKEMYIYKRLRELCEYQPKYISKDDLEEVIKNFEERKHRELNLPDDVPYKLEERQRDAVLILGEGNRVMTLTGPAGSGKTTTVEAVLSAIEQLLGVRQHEVYFCAPTGKAANRLKEVVKRRTRTIHSLFNLRGESLSLKDKNTSKLDDIKVLIMDESSMPNVNVMYDVVRKLADGTYVFFLGDIEQLPPIGFGKPFYNLLQFLPTVVLNVTKRASESSQITRNAKKIIYENTKVMTNLDDGEDYRNIAFADPTKTAGIVKSLVDFHLGNSDFCPFNPIMNKDGSRVLLEPDDIQIISPINGKEWGINYLNRELQNSFNPLEKTKGYVAVIKKRNEEEPVQFRVGDRVAHINKNLNEMLRFVEQDGVYHVWCGSNGKPVTGIANGELGKVSRVVMAEDIEVADFYDEDERNLCEDYQRGGSTAFVIVAYQDTDTETGELVEFYIFYTMTVEAEIGRELHVTSIDLDYLDLSYAGTVHRMQGSQAKMVICVFHKIGGSFITRNMVYTALTRAKKYAYMLGDVKGSQSSVAKARRLQAMDMRRSVLDVMV